MARSVKRVVLVLLAAAVLAFAAWMLWPRSIGDAVDLEGEDLYGFLVTLNVRDGQSQTDSESYTVSADSEQAEAILELLDQYTYHFCWDTLTGADVISEIGDIIVDLDASGDLAEAFRLQRHRQSQGQRPGGPYRLFWQWAGRRTVRTALRYPPGRIGGCKLNPVSL